MPVVRATAVAYSASAVASASLAGVGVSSYDGGQPLFYSNSLHGCQILWKGRWRHYVNRYGGVGACDDGNTGGGQVERNNCHHVLGHGCQRRDDNGAGGQRWRRGWRLANTNDQRWRIAFGLGTQTAIPGEERISALARGEDAHRNRLGPLQDLLRQPGTCIRHPTSIG